MESIGRAGNNSVTGTLSAALKDSNTSVRASALNASGKLKLINMQDLIVKALEDKNYNVRSEAIMALGELSNPKSIAILEKFLKDNKYDIWASAAIIHIISPD